MRGIEQKPPKNKFFLWLSFKSFLRVFVVIALCVFTFTGCRMKSHYSEIKLPLPPSVNSGVTMGQFVQVGYGFGFPMPPKWLFLQLSADQEVDEVARFSDPTRAMVARVAVQLLGPDQKFSAKSWIAGVEQDWKARQFQIVKGPKMTEWKTTDSGPWVAFSYRVLDDRKKEWQEEEWGLSKDDMLLTVHATLPKEDLDSDKGNKFLKELEGSLTQIKWYTPIGPRGISIDRFELQYFTEGFRQALQSGSISKTAPYFDEMYPDRPKWLSWYQQLTASSDPKSLELKAELFGLVINGDDATVSFTVVKKDKSSPKPQKLEKSFRLSKKEGSWKITASIDKN